MNTATKKLWNNFKAQPDIWFFYGFLLTFTLSIRKVLKFYPIMGQFNEYAGIYLYLSDIFLILTLVLWGISILRNKSDSLSNIKLYLGLKKPLFKLLLFFNLWVFASIIWSDNPTIALFRAIKILELSLLFFYVAIGMFHPRRNVPRVPRGTSYGAGACPPKNCSTWNNSWRVEQIWEGGTILRQLFQIIIILGLFQAIIGIWQFFVQHSVGLFWLLKESLISPDLPGVAKVIFGGEKFIRAYGLFPHPNILGGFLVFSMVATWAYFKLFHPNQNVPPQKKCSTPEEMFHPNTNVPRGTSYEANVEQFSFHSGGTPSNFLFKFLPLFIGIQLLALLLTFSKSAILGLIITVVYILFHTCPVKPKCSTLAPCLQNVPRGTFCKFTGWNIWKVFGVKHYWKEITIILLIAILVLNWLNLDWNTFLIKSWSERVVYLKATPLIKCFTPAPQLSIVPRLPRETKLFHVEQFSFFRGGTIESCSGWNNFQLLIFGVGIGQFVPDMQKYSPIKLESWQFQPVHNVFLLIWSELGLIGLALFTWFLWRLLHNNKECFTPAPDLSNVPRGTFERYLGWNINRVIKAILLGFLFISLFDHYLWDIQQGQIMLWLVAGLLARFRTSKQNT